MASSQGVNVIRYSALFTGLVYGIYHQSSIRTHEKVAKLEHEYHHKEALIEQARAEYARKTAPPASISIGVITDPDDKRFDLEKFLLTKAAEK